MSSELLSYSVPGMTCEHCRAAIVNEVAGVAGVESVDVDLDGKVVSVHGAAVSDEDAVRSDRRGRLRHRRRTVSS